MTESGASSIDRRRFVAAAAAAAGIGAIGRFRGSIEDRPWVPSDDLLSDLPRVMRLASVPAVSIAVVENGAVHWTRAIGVANASTGAPVTEASVFPAASLGKAVFAAMVHGLVAAGTLDLDRPLVTWFRPEDLPTDPRLDKITPRHVLSHSSGLRNWRNRPDQPLAPDFEPGARFQYSGEGFFWLQRVVEQVTGKGVDRVMRERLFDPAGMASATYGWSKRHAELTVAGHFNRGQVGNHFSRTLGDKLLPVAEKWGRPMSDWTAADVVKALGEVDPSAQKLPNFLVPNVAGSLLCSPIDYARFMALLIGGSGLPAASRASMLTSTTPVEGPLSWGVGVGLEKRGEDQLFWHWGDNGIFRAFMVGHPARKRGIAVFTNADSGPRIYQRVIRSATGLDLDAFVWV